MMVLVFLSSYLSVCLSVCLYVCLSLPRTFFTPSKLSVLLLLSPPNIASTYDFVYFLSFTLIFFFILAHSTLTFLSSCYSIFLSLVPSASVFLSGTLHSTIIFIFCNQQLHFYSRPPRFPIYFRRYPLSPPPFIRSLRGY